MGKEIITFVDLLSRIYGKSTGSICHYTSFENLLLMLKYRTFRLTRFDLLNDKAERELSCCEDGETRYVMSFTGTSESVAMWAMYGGKSSMKLRIKLSRGDLIASVNNNFYKDKNRKGKFPLDELHKGTEDYTKKLFSLSDMVYYDQQRSKLRLDARQLNAIEVTNKTLETLTGNIKYRPWEFEKETRLWVTLKQNESNEEFRHIYAGISEKLVKKMEILYCPWIEDAVFDKITTCLDEAAGVKLLHSRSEITGQVDQM